MLPISSPPDDAPARHSHRAKIGDGRWRKLRRGFERRILDAAFAIVFADVFVMLANILWRLL